MKILLRLARHFRPYLGRMIAGALLLAIAGGLMSLVLATVKPLVDRVFVAPAAAESALPAGDLVARLRARLPGAEWLPRRPFVEVPLFLLVVFFLRGAVLYFGRYQVLASGASVIRDLRLEVYEAVIVQSRRFFEGHSSGVIQARLLADVERVKRISTEVLGDLLRVSAMIPFLVLLVFLHDWRFSILALVALPVAAFPVVRLGQRLRRASRSSQASLAEAASLVGETVAGIAVVQAFLMERLAVTRFRAALGRVLRAEKRAVRADALSTPILELIAAVAGAALFAVAGARVARATLDPGDFAVVLSGLGMLFLSLRRLNRVNVELQQGLAAAERVFDLLDWPQDIRDAPDARPLPPFRREIAFQGVHFNYGRKPVLAGIDLVIRKGERVALVGPSGAGKTTLAHLILRFYDPSSGSVGVDGQDLRGVTLASLRSQVGIVTQDVVLFDATVHENIACFRPEASRERVVEAARSAHADAFVAGLPDGYDTGLGEGGARLSAGERQRLAIARALFADPPILLLDEATSALDALSESVVQEALEVLLRGRTSLVIAHRLATVREATRILVLDGGRIVDEGRHDELLARGGLYRRLYEAQHRPDGS